MSFTHLIKPQVLDVQLEKGKEILTGTLHLTVHNIIFNHPDGELWVYFIQENSDISYIVNSLPTFCIDTISYPAHSRTTTAITPNWTSSSLYQMS